MGGWSCPYELQGQCQLRRRPCVPGEKGCILHKPGVKWEEPPLPPEEPRRKKR